MRIPATTLASLALPRPSSLSLSPSILSLSISRGYAKRLEKRRQAPVKSSKHHKPPAHGITPSSKDKSQRKPSVPDSQRRPPASPPCDDNIHDTHDHDSNNVIPEHKQREMRLELPGMPGAIFSEPERELSDIANFQKLSWAIEDKKAAVATYRFSLTVLCRGQKVQVTKRGLRRKLERPTAFLHVLSSLHETGMLHEIWGHAQLKLDPKVLAAEKNALVNVYDYAARDGLLPNVSCVRKVFKRRSFYLVQIALPEHDIHVSAAAKDVRVAEAGAIIKFKNAAQKFHSARQITGDPAAQKSSPLSSATAESFLAYLSDRKIPDVNIDIQDPEDEADPSAKSLRLISRAHIAVGGVATGHTIVTSYMKHVSTLAPLVGAVVLARQRPDLVEGFTEALRVGNGEYLRKVRPIELHLSSNAIEEMNIVNHMVRSHRQAQRYRDQGSLDRGKVEVTRRFPHHALNAAQQADKSTALKAKLKEYEERPDLRHLRQAKAQLPMSQYASEVLELVGNNIYSIVIGATGSGKTTQVPQLLLDEAIRKGEGASCNVICTQPRRIAATSVARRVADERAEGLQQTVGYHVRFDPRPPRPHGSILYSTTGILLQQLQHGADSVLEHASHLVIDEVHERDLNVDMLLLTLKKAMVERVRKGLKVPRVIFMSATIDAELVAAYFQNTLPLNYQGTIGNDCPTLSVPGRTFPVQEQYLDHIMSDMQKRHDSSALRRLIDQDKDSYEYLEAEMAEPAQRGLETRGLGSSTSIDWKTPPRQDLDADTKRDALVPLGLIAATIAHIVKITDDDGGILVFLPGLAEILKLGEQLERDQPLGVNFNNSNDFRIFMLHSSSPDSQARVFDPLPTGCRKIILSTNIAETSVTLPDVRHIVDTGKMRQKNFDQRRRITSLRCTWISKSSAKQRAGRAGRVANGSYYALFTRSRRESMRQTDLPELLRCDLQETCLFIKSQQAFMKIPVGELLSQVIEPPASTAVDLAVQNLKDLGAFDANEIITSLGRVLSSLPVQPALGRMIIMGLIFRCLSPMIVLGAAMAERSPFLVPLDRKKEAQGFRKTNFAPDSRSDHMAFLDAYQKFADTQARKGEQAAKHWCYNHFISFQVMKSIDSSAKQIEEILLESGLIKPRKTTSSTAIDPIYNENADSDSVIRALLAAGLSPNIARGFRRVFRTASEARAMPTQSSANQRLPPVDPCDAHLLVFTGLALANDGSCMFLQDTTLITPLTAVLFGGRDCSYGEGGLVDVDGWLRFFVKPDSQGTSRQSSILTLLRFNRSLKMAITFALRELLDGRSPARRSRLQGLDGESRFDNPVLTRLATISLPSLLQPPDTRPHESKSRPRASKRETRQNTKAAPGIYRIDSRKVTLGRPKVHGSASV